jgi:hypothetical protein
MKDGQGEINVRRLLDGSVRYLGPPCFIVSPQGAIEIARALLHEAGVEVIFADPGQTVIRPSSVFGKGNGR